MKTNKIRVNKKLYDSSAVGYRFLKDKLFPTLIVLCWLAIFASSAISVGMVARYFFDNPKVGLFALGFVVLVVFSIIFVFLYCEPKDLEPDMCGITIPDYKDGVPMELVHFVRGVIYVKGKENVFNFLLNEHAIGNNPYPYYSAKQTEIEYVEQCLVYDYQKCLKDEGIYQDAYNSLTSMFKHKENDKSF